MKEKAQGLVEFSLVLPLLMMLIFGIIEFGRLLFVYSAVTTASREAARYGSAAGEVTAGTLRFMDCAGIEAAARRVGILADISAVNISYDSGPGTATISGGCPPAPDEIIGGRHRVVVQVSAEYQPLVPLVGLESFSINSQSARTIFSNIVVGQFPQNPAHVANLESIPPVVGGSGWQARVRVTIRDEEDMPVSDATVVGKWYSKGGSVLACTMVTDNTLPNGTSITTKSCETATDSSGVCENENNFPSGHQNALFVVADIFHVEKAYDPTANVVSCIEFTKP